MTREEAIKVLAENLKQRSDGYYSYLQHYGHRDDSEEEYLDALDMAIAALREQDVTDINVGNKWISVDERLPEGWWIDPDTGIGEPEDYLVFVKGAIAPTVANYINGKFVNLQQDATGFAGVITHWMPLPAAPKEEVWEK